jgi:hypothetical protein
VKLYRRIEVNAFRRRVTIVSGDWPAERNEMLPCHEELGVSLADRASGELIEPDSPEGQQILIEAMRSLQGRLAPEARMAMSATQLTPALRKRTRFYRRLKSIYRFICPTALPRSRKEK